MDLPDVVNQWLQELHNQGKSQHTINAYQRALKHFINWDQVTTGSTFDPAAVSHRDIQDWISRQQTTEKAKPATINQRLAALANFFTWAFNNNFAHRIPTIEVESLRIPKHAPKALPEQDLRRFLRAVYAEGKIRDIAIVEMFVGTGLRVGELLALRIGDLTLNARSGHVVVRKGKRGQQREVPLGTTVRRELRRYLESLYPDWQNHPDECLWTGQRNEPITTRSSILRILEKYSHAAQLLDENGKVKAIGPHALRHTFATRFLKANPGDLRNLAAILGHASITTTMIYTEPTLEDLADRMEKMENGH